MSDKKIKNIDEIENEFDDDFFDEEEKEDEEDKDEDLDELIKIDDKEDDEDDDKTKEDAKKDKELLEKHVDHVLPINLANCMQDSFLSYAMSVIVSRALPDVRDGLKPVQRRIL